ncbi:MAG TPA: SDR family oxidoreductase [Chloroflexi bacterium]|nr:SDR family oxidoreductase [Chloroflexota bacterium]
MKTEHSLQGKTFLVTGGARRVGKALALGIAQAGGDVVIHYGRSQAQAQATAGEIEAAGSRAWLLQADLNDPAQVQTLVERAWERTPLAGVVNSAAIFAPVGWDDTTLGAWEQHLRINLTAPFLLSQTFALRLPPEREGVILNIVDWRALRPGADHLPYTVSKAGLTALTQALAVALGPRITVNALALGAILPPSDGGDTAPVVRGLPVERWAELEEVQAATVFLLGGPRYITGEIIHLDGGRHLI